MKRTLLLVIIVGFVCSVVLAQKEDHIWCFGTNCGVDFNGGSPVSFPGVAMNQTEGSSSIADSAGSLLFYTDGGRVWNKNHVLMPNGSGLLGGSSSSQAALIVKQPGNANIYYVFTTDHFSGVRGFKYSIVDMNLQSGLGDVTIKNVSILSVSDERVAAVTHANGRDVWIITTTDSTNIIKSFLLTNLGLNLTPVVTITGVMHDISFQGYLKPSPSGNKLAVAYFDGGFDVYDFDKATGKVSNPIAIQGVGSPGTELEFAL